ncbi:hypothetical protein CSKR_104164 [Clonorchis sinensis]|uniref:Uncharacterized protein n=1 Tax=Clonorchis sinensis TaxID=79923 RepID=A0A419PSE2_CLOSI|nr:hypothetical protein CSKR_104164 [Clonorchis sinensis]
MCVRVKVGRSIDMVNLESTLTWFNQSFHISPVIRLPLHIRACFYTTQTLSCRFNERLNRIRRLTLSVRLQIGFSEKSHSRSYPGKTEIRNTLRRWKNTEQMLRDHFDERGLSGGAKSQRMRTLFHKSTDLSLQSVNRSISRLTQRGEKESSSYSRLILKSLEIQGYTALSPKVTQIGKRDPTVRDLSTSSVTQQSEVIRLPRRVKRSKTSSVSPWIAITGIPFARINRNSLRVSPKNHDFRRQCPQNEFKWVRLMNSTISNAVGFLIGLSIEIPSCMVYCSLMQNCFAFDWGKREGACKFDNNSGLYVATASSNNDVYQMECCGEFATYLFTPHFS